MAQQDGGNNGGKRMKGKMVQAGDETRENNTALPFLSICSSHAYDECQYCVARGLRGVGK